MHQQLSLGAFGATGGADLREAARRLVAELEAARCARNLSHRRLAGLAGLPASTVRSALGADANPQLDTLMALAGALGLGLGLAERRGS